MSIDLIRLHQNEANKIDTNFHSNDETNKISLIMHNTCSIVRKLKWPILFYLFVVHLLILSRIYQFLIQSSRINTIRLIFVIQRQYIIYVGWILSINNDILCIFSVYSVNMALFLNDSIYDDWKFIDKNQNKINNIDSHL